MEKCILDANVILRFLRADHPQHSAKANALFQQAETGKLRLILLEVVLAETIWVLTSYYECKRKDVVETLLPLVRHGGIECENEPVLVDALQRYFKYNLDFMDCLIAAHASSKNHPVSSFDRDYRKFDDITLFTPGE